MAILISDTINNSLYSERNNTEFESTSESELNKDKYWEEAFQHRV